MKLQDSWETVIVEGADVLDYITGLPHNAEVIEYNYGRCCDIGFWEHEETESDRESVLWSAINWHREPERFELEFKPNRFDNPDWYYPVTFRIFAGDACEPNTYVFTIRQPLPESE